MDFDKYLDFIFDGKSTTVAFLMNIFQQLNTKRCIHKDIKPYIYIFEKMLLCVMFRKHFDTTSYSHRRMNMEKLYRSKRKH